MPHTLPTLPFITFHGTRPLKLVYRSLSGYAFDAWYRNGLLSGDGRWSGSGDSLDTADVEAALHAGYWRPMGGLSVAELNVLAEGGVAADHMRERLSLPEAVMLSVAEQMLGAVIEAERGTSG